MKLFNKKGNFSSLKILLILSLIVLSGCLVVEYKETTDTEFLEGEKVADKDYVYDIQLLTEGFDIDQIDMKPGESLTITVTDESSAGHFITLDGDRIVDKEFNSGDRINIPFEESGTFEVVDEQTGAMVLVNVG